MGEIAWISQLAVPLLQRARNKAPFEQEEQEHEDGSSGCSVPRQIPRKVSSSLPRDHLVVRDVPSLLIYTRNSLKHLPFIANIFAFVTLLPS